jgi:hypothetical protein
MFADWIELLALASPRRSASRADIIRLISKQADIEHGIEADPDTGEGLEAEILESASFQLGDNVADELAFRAQTLDVSYPFELTMRAETWSIEVRPTTLEKPAARVYVFCLLISALRDRRLAGGAIIAEAKEDFTRLFQNVSYLAAIRLMGNSGMSFGSPRPDGSTFLEAIEEFITAFGIGEPRSQFLPSSMRKEKDEGVDVIAWRSFADGRPGQMLLLGQVASGHDWPDKPVAPAVGKFLDWFVTHPSRFYLPAIFIPFVQQSATIAAEPRSRMVSLSTDFV